MQTVPPAGVQRMRTYIWVFTGHIYDIIFLNGVKIHLNSENSGVPGVRVRTADMCRIQEVRL